MKMRWRARAFRRPTSTSTRLLEFAFRPGAGKRAFLKKAWTSGIVEVPWVRRRTECGYLPTTGITAIHLKMLRFGLAVKTVITVWYAREASRGREVDMGTPAVTVLMTQYPRAFYRRSHRKRIGAGFPAGGNGNSRRGRWLCRPRARNRAQIRALRGSYLTNVLGSRCSI